MKFLFDFFPVLLFFATFKVAGMFESASFKLATKLVGPFMTGDGMKPDQGPIMIATIVAIIAAVLQIGYVKARGRKVDLLLWISASVIIIFGSLTIYFHNDDFIKWKPTIIYWLQGVAFLLALVVFKKNLVRETMGSQITLPDPVWDRMCKTWIIVFFAIGAINLLFAFVIFKDNTPAWVNFKTFGLTGMLLAFIVAQTFYLAKHIEPEKEEQA